MEASGLQARVLAADAALRALYATADDLAGALLASHRLAQLPPALGLGGGVEGAVVAHTEWTGGVKLRVVEGVEALALVPGGHELDRSATLLRLRPGEPAPVPLSELHVSRALPSAQPKTWRDGRLAFYADAEAETAAAAAAGNQAAASGGGGGDGDGADASACLGTRESCCLAALRLAKLTQLQQPLAELERLLKGAGTDGLGDAEALLGGGGVSLAVRLAPVDRENALRLAHTISLTCCQEPDPDALEGLLNQLKGVEEAERAWRRRSQQQQEDEAQQQRADERERQAAADEGEARARGRDASRGAGSSPSPQAHKRARTDGGRGGGGGGGSGRGGAGADASLVERWIEQQPDAPERLPPEGEAALESEVFAGDVFSGGGCVTDLDKRELLELLLALAIAHAASHRGWPPAAACAEPPPAAASNDQWHAAAGNGRVAVDLRLLAARLPEGARRFLQDYAPTGGAAAEGGGGGGGTSATAATAAALAHWIPRKCRAVQLVEGNGARRPPSAVLAPQWQRSLLGHVLLRHSKRGLERAAAAAAKGAGGVLAMEAAWRMAPLHMRLYFLLNNSLRDALDLNLGPSLVVAADAVTHVPFMATREAANRGPQLPPSPGAAAAAALSPRGAAPQAHGAPDGGAGRGSADRERERRAEPADRGRRATPDRNGAAADPAPRSEGQCPSTGGARSARRARSSSCVRSRSERRSRSRDRGRSRSRDRNRTAGRSRSRSRDRGHSRERGRSYDWGRSRGQGRSRERSRSRSRSGERDRRRSAERRGEQPHAAGPGFVLGPRRPASPLGDESLAGYGWRGFGGCDAEPGRPRAGGDAPPPPGERTGTVFDRLGERNPAPQGGPGPPRPPSRSGSREPRLGPRRGGEHLDFAGFDGGGGGGGGSGGGGGGGLAAIKAGMVEVRGAMHVNNAPRLRMAELADVAPQLEAEAQRLGMPLTQFVERHMGGLLALQQYGDVTWAELGPKGTGLLPSGVMHGWGPCHRWKNARSCLFGTRCRYRHGV